MEKIMTKRVNINSYSGEKYKFLKKIYMIFTCTVIFVSVCFTVAINFSDIKIWYNRVFPPESISVLNLTSEQKKEDFNYLCNVLENGMPVLSVLESECDLDYYALKTDYEKRIENTVSDMEFYCMLNSFLNTIPSAHTFLCTPSYSNYEALNCNNSYNMLAVRGLKQYSDYWNEEVSTALSTAAYGDVYCATYSSHDGSYYFNNGDKIISINGISVDEYIIETPMIYSLCFDGINQKLYRSNIFFSSENAGGEKVKLMIDSGEGVIETNLYGGGYNDYSIVLSDMNNSDNSSENTDLLSVTNEYSFNTDDSNQLLYADISVLNYDNAEYIKSMLENRKYNTVILDLRNNPGGNPQLFFNSIYTPLVKDDMTADFKWYTPETKINKKNVFFYNPLYGVYVRIRDGVKYAEIDSLPDMGSKYVENNYSYLCTGNQVKDADIYLLISSRTASAADKLTAVLSKKTKVFITGDSTAGEGMGNSPAADILPNSHLIFIYYPSIAYNIDGSNNSIHGTSPDRFIYEYNIEHLSIMKELFRNGQDPYTYENRLKWDNVLIETLEIVQANRK